MASSKLDPLILPSSEDHISHAQNYAVLPPFFNRRRRKKICLCSLLFLAVAAALFALWPSDPHLKIARLRLLHGEGLGSRDFRGRAREGEGSSYVDAVVDVYGTDLISDWIYLLDDLAKGLIRFDTLIQVAGCIGLFLFKVPLKVTFNHTFELSRTHD
ncbi:hypothetical protein Cgig2_020534 [Carnegiea gigantea]|uniref:Uncharacterized protein n=1 Tax=Carnegiea gigantea TaxID=171969 RepID=A0A9Q1KBV9_9CARY|nr:hypothetical protein Cgig2_020534 [Carnegiea gigantea]